MLKTVTVAAHLPAKPEKLFAMYLNAKSHAAFTGAPAKIQAKAGAAFSAFGGILTGKMLHVDKRGLIVQTWRSGNWPKNAIDSILTLTFWPEGSGTRIELIHANVPLSDFAGISQGWEKYYWTPWRAYLEARKS